VDGEFLLTCLICHMLDWKCVLHFRPALAFIGLRPIFLRGKVAGARVWPFTFICCRDLCYSRDVPPCNVCVFFKTRVFN